ncbi:MAG: hypothetical protein ACE5DL_02845 [Nitrosopumilaceae archaeon]
MSLDLEVKKILETFDQTPSNKIIEILKQIQAQFHSSITKEYLNGKLKTIEGASEEEKKKLCKNLKPYFEWYLQKN